MIIPVLSSTLLLTLLLTVGLLFFVKASVKDRTQVVTLHSDQARQLVAQQLETYFTQRAYRITAVDAESQQVTFEGVVRPSVFLAVFLILLTAIALLCLSLVGSVLLPSLAQSLPFAVLLSPLAGLFYWQGAKRSETVSLEIKQAEDESASVRSIVKVSAHRDELAQLQRSFPLKPVESGN